MLLMSGTHVLDQELKIHFPTLEPQRYSDMGDETKSWEQKERKG